MASKEKTRAAFQFLSMLVDVGYNTQLSCTTSDPSLLSTSVHDWYDHSPKCMVISWSSDEEGSVEKLRNLQEVPTKSTTNADAAHQNGIQYIYLGRGSPFFGKNAGKGSSLMVGGNCYI